MGKRPARKKRAVGSEKAPRTYRLSPRKISAAQRVLGTATATATIEQALDLVVFREELAEGLRNMLGVPIESFDDE